MSKKLNMALMIGRLSNFTHGVSSVSEENVDIMQKQSPKVQDPIWFLERSQNHFSGHLPDQHERSLMKHLNNWPTG